MSAPLPQPTLYSAPILLCDRPEPANADHSGYHSSIMDRLKNTALRVVDRRTLAAEVLLFKDGDRCTLRCFKDDSPTPEGGTPLWYTPMKDLPLKSYFKSTTFLACDRRVDHCLRRVIDVVKNPAEEGVW